LRQELPKRQREARDQIAPSEDAVLFVERKKQLGAS